MTYDQPIEYGVLAPRLMNYQYVTSKLNVASLLKNRVSHFHPPGDEVITGVTWEQGLANQPRFEKIISRGVWRLNRVTRLALVLL